MFHRTSSTKRSMVIVIIAVLAALLTACSRPDATAQNETPSSSAGETAEPEAVEVLAPIESVEILVAESFPPQYFLFVRSGLPDTCTRFDRYEVTRDGDVIRVTIINLERADPDCKQEYSTVENNIPLGSDLQAGKTYTVVVHDVTKTFVTQGAPPGPDQVAETLGGPFQLKVGQTASVAPQGPIVEFVEVVEDSRCPAGATCAWAGRARITIRVSSSGDALGFGVRELTLEAERVDPAKDSVQGAYDTYLFQLVALDPYPQVPKGEDAQGEQPEYTATLVVSKLGGEPTPVAAGTPTSAPTSVPTSTPACTVREDWYEHTVVRGDTLFNIARRSGSSVDELVAANCLADPSRIFVGQKLYVPRPVTSEDSPPTAFAKFYLILPGDGGQSGPAVGCGDSAVAVWRSRAQSGSTPDDIRASLEELFSIKTTTYGPSGYVHSLYAAELTVRSVTVRGDRALIDLSGTLQLVGVCADARMEAQILFTIFQYPGFSDALITIDGKNMRQLFDVSGTVGDDEPYERSEVAF